MISIKYVTHDDKSFWYSLDKYLPEKEFEKKVKDHQGYIKKKGFCVIILLDVSFIML